MITPDSNPWNEIIVNSWSSLIEALHNPTLIPIRHEEGNHCRSPYVFRGLADDSWPLATSLERLGTPPVLIERSALRGFRKYSPPEIFHTESEWELLAVAQHNGLPTRVLDWTLSPLVAAHFATVERQYFSKNGVIWCINASIIRDKFLTQEMHESLHNEKAWVFDVHILASLFNDLNDFDILSAKDGDICALFEPPSIDARIVNQLSILSVMNGPNKSHDLLLRKNAGIPGLVQRIIIDHRAKAEIRDMLDQNNITERMLFPGLPGLCDWLRRYYGPI